MKLIDKVASICSVYFICGLLLLPCRSNAQGITINSGSLVLNDATYLVLSDGGFNNNGTFNAGNSYLVFNGNSLTTNSFIGGNSFTTFNNITINKSAYGVQLNSDVTLNGNLYMLSDSLYLNGHTLNMGINAALVGENANAPITGTSGGTISLSRNLNAPNSFNPGNIGIEITSLANLGITTIKRGHIQQTTPDGGKSILRYFDISPTNNAALSATVKFYYSDAELEGINEAELNMYASVNRVNDWILLGKDGSDANNDWVLKNGVNQLNRITLASRINNPLPVNLLIFNARYMYDVAVIQWQTASEQNSSYFNIQRSSDANRFENIGKIMAAGNSSIIKNYSFTDADVSNLGKTKIYYRLEEVDNSNKIHYSKITSVDISLYKKVVINPNPADDKVKLGFHGIKINNDSYVILTDANGRRIMAKQIPLNSYSIELPISFLSRGIYWIIIDNASERYTEKIIKK